MLIRYIDLLIYPLTAKEIARKEGRLDIVVR